MMWIGRCFWGCFFLMQLQFLQVSCAECGTPEKIKLIKNEVSYCKFLTWMMHSEQLPTEIGLPWVYEVLENVEEKLDELECEQTEPNYYD